MKQRPIRTTVFKHDTGSNIVTRLSVPKAFADHFELERGDVVWVEVKHIIKGDTHDKD